MTDVSSERHEEWVPGNSGKRDYLVVVEKPGVALGLKVTGIVRVRDNMYMLACKLRSVWVHEKKDTGNVVSLPQKSLTEGWPDVEFSKVDERRASTVFEVSFEVDDDVEGVAEVLKRGSDENDPFVRAVEHVVQLAGVAPVDEIPRLAETLRSRVYRTNRRAIDVMIKQREITAKMKESASGQVTNYSEELVKALEGLVSDASGHSDQ